VTVAAKEPANGENVLVFVMAAGAVVTRS